MNAKLKIWHDYMERPLEIAVDDYLEKYVESVEKIYFKQNGDRHTCYLVYKPKEGALQ